MYLNKKEATFLPYKLQITDIQLYTYTLVVAA